MKPPHGRPLQWATHSVHASRLRFYLRIPFIQNKLLQIDSVMVFYRCIPVLFQDDPIQIKAVQCGDGHSIMDHIRQFLAQLRLQILIAGGFPSRLFVQKLFS